MVKDYVEKLQIAADFCRAFQNSLTCGLQQVVVVSSKLSPASRRGAVKEIFSFSGFMFLYDLNDLIFVRDFFSFCVLDEIVLPVSQLSDLIFFYFRS